jgi:uncharacterized protein YeaO (DUF488 family)
MIDRAKKTKSSRGSHAAPRGKFEIRIRRVYDDSSAGEGARFLVDGLWPRGVRKEALTSIKWVREVAPSANLRKWYGHDPEKWKEFQKRYRSELQKNAVAWKPLMKAAKEGDVTLLTATREVEISHATVLREFLKRKAAVSRRPGASTVSR